MGLSDLLLRVTTQRRVTSLLQRTWHSGAISHGPKNARAISLTFDGGPDPFWTPRVLDALDAARARATFFVVGTRAAEHAAVVREARRRGHEIGTQLFSVTPTVRDETSFGDELARSLATLSDVLGERVHWLRVPDGTRAAQRPSRVWKRFQVGVAHFTFRGDDRAQPAEGVVSRVAAALRPGAIVQLYDACRDDALEATSCAALPGIAAAARARSLRMVTLSDLVDRAPVQPR